MPVCDLSRLLDNRVGALRQAHADAGLDMAQIDVSGGIDSAVMAGLLVKALGRDKVIAVHSRLHTDEDATARAHALCDAIGLPLLDVDLGLPFDLLLAAIGTAVADAVPFDVEQAMTARIAADPTILGSLRSTLRAPVGRACNRMLGGGIRHGTGNECEDRWLRYFQKGGDGEVDSNPIAMLSKAEVYQLAWGLAHQLGTGSRVLDAYAAITAATPSADLWGDDDEQSDEDELLALYGAPLTYGRVHPGTWDYAAVGTIERVSRTADVASVLFVDGLLDCYFDRIVWRALDGPMADMPEDDARALLIAARKAEAATRHKATTLPTYGSRGDLVALGLLTNELPRL